MKNILQASKKEKSPEVTLQNLKTSYGDLQKKINDLDQKITKKVKKFEDSIVNLRQELEALRIKEILKKDKIEQLSQKIDYTNKSDLYGKDAFELDNEDDNTPPLS